MNRVPIRFVFALMKGDFSVGTFMVTPLPHNKYHYALADIRGSDKLPWGFCYAGTRNFIGPEDRLQATVLQAWVSSRIVRPSRYNIEDLLRKLGLSHYDEFELLRYNKARVPWDDYWIEEVEALAQ